MVFTSIYLERPHILMLDEPTNHLDMQSIDALAKALNAFEVRMIYLLVINQTFWHLDLFPLFFLLSLDI